MKILLLLLGRYLGLLRRNLEQIFHLFVRAKEGLRLLFLLFLVWRVEEG